MLSQLMMEIGLEPLLHSIQGTETLLNHPACGKHGDRACEYCSSCSRAFTSSFIECDRTLCCCSPPTEQKDCHTWAIHASQSDWPARENWI